MGWTSKDYTDAKHTSFTLEHAKRFMNEEYNTSGYSVLKCSLKKAKDKYHKNIIYSAIKHPKDHVFGMVVLIEIANDEIYWKEMDETMGPSQEECPKEIIGMLSETEYEYAIKWRKNCLKNDKE